MFRSLSSRLYAVWLLILAAVAAAFWLAFVPRGQAFAGAVGMAVDHPITGPRLGLAVVCAISLIGLVWLSASLGAVARRLEALRQVVCGQRDEPLVPASAAYPRELDRLAVAFAEQVSSWRQAFENAAETARATSETRRQAALQRAAAAIAGRLDAPLATLRADIQTASGRDAVARLDYLLGDLRLLTDYQPVLSEVELAPFLTERIGAQRAFAAQSGIVLSARAATPSWPFDPEGVGWALDALVANALAYTPAGGAVRIDARTVDDHLSITVGDTGPGVDPALRPTLFQPFAAGRPDGAGLGLAVVKAVAEAHGGAVCLRETERGAIFALELPWRAEVGRAEAGTAC